MNRFVATWMHAAAAERSCLSWIREASREEKQAEESQAEKRLWRMSNKKNRQMHSQACTPPIGLDRNLLEPPMASSTKVPRTSGGMSFVMPSFSERGKRNCIR
jgi:hypothetical protein